ncbi:hypothetical protein PG994_005419 [Apiospora phragmitis]|uniref:Uncharacterized protein n=1 Tax=Apiospora phragmitis TaxID=2905665 RepID=A0ABR1VC72_9PEZI
MPASLSDHSAATGRTSNTERTVTDRSTLQPTISIDEQHDNFLNIRNKTPRAQRQGPGNRTSSTNNMGHESDFSNRDSGSYFEGATLNAVPTSPRPSQFITPSTGRTMSFYEMQEQAKQAKKEARQQAKKDRRSSMMINRPSWRSGEMPYNYADHIGGNRHDYNPPTMGRPPRDNRHSAGNWTMTGGGGGRDTPDPFSMRLP